ncbi:MAG: anti-sigma factor antagonist [Clostridia bacterium]|nr:anti-sigma factor antagonist [Clostridia bacterium]
MESRFDNEDNVLYFFITEEIDHHTTEKIRRKMDYEITRFMPRKVVFDFSKVTFMDSAGIGLLIGRYKLAKMLGGVTTMINTNKNIEKVFEMSGILKIIPIESKTSGTVPFVS